MISTSVHITVTKLSQRKTKYQPSICSSNPYSVNLSLITSHLRLKTSVSSSASLSLQQLRRLRTKCHIEYDRDLPVYPFAQAYREDFSLFLSMCPGTMAEKVFKPNIWHSICQVPKIRFLPFSLAAAPRLAKNYRRA